MQKQYTLIQDSLQVLRQCDIPAIPKLRLEVQLFQIKLLLLRDEMSREAKETFCSEGMLREIHHQLTGVDQNEAKDVAIEAIAQRLQQIGSDLAKATLSAHNWQDPRL